MKLEESSLKSKTACEVKNINVFLRKKSISKEIIVQLATLCIVDPKIMFDTVRFLKSQDVTSDQCFYSKQLQ